MRVRGKGKRGKEKEGRGEVGGGGGRNRGREEGREVRKEGGRGMEEVDKRGKVRCCHKEKLIYTQGKYLLRGGNTNAVIIFTPAVQLFAYIPTVTKNKHE